MYIDHNIIIKNDTDKLTDKSMEISQQRLEKEIKSNHLVRNFLHIFG